MRELRPALPRHEQEGNTPLVQYEPVRQSIEGRGLHEAKKSGKLRRLKSKTGQRPGISGNLKAGEDWAGSSWFLQRKTPDCYT
jgi:hypothetical protein